MQTIHATTVAIDGKGILIRGPSGSGKSDLALKLIDGGAELVADDRAQLTREGDRIVARAPKTIAGRLEVRGLGIVTLPYRASVPLDLVVDLVPGEAVERMPDSHKVSLLDLELPALQLDPFESSAAAKVRLAVRTVLIAPEAVP